MFEFFQAVQEEDQDSLYDGELCFQGHGIEKVKRGKEAAMRVEVEVNA